MHCRLRRPFARIAAHLPLLSIIWTFGCASPSAPIGVVRLALDRASIPTGGPLEATIQFDLPPTFEPLGEDYHVFLQLLDEDGELLVSTEHAPPRPTTAWRPGQSIRYTQELTIPAYPYIGPATIAVGLQSRVSGRRLALAGDDLGELAYRVATLTIEPRHESSYVLYDEGWHQLEFDVFDRASWRWTTGRAVLTFRNPHRETRMILQLQGRPDLFAVPQRLTLLVGGRPLDDVTLDTGDRVRLAYRLTTAHLGKAENVRVELLVDQTFQPAALNTGAQDTRKLGVQLFDAYVEPLPESRR